MNYTSIIWKSVNSTCRNKYCINLAVNVYQTISLYVLYFGSFWKKTMLCVYYNYYYIHSYLHIFYIYVHNHIIIEFVGIADRTQRAHAFKNKWKWSAKEREWKSGNRYIYMLNANKTRLGWMGIDGHHDSSTYSVVMILLRSIVCLSVYFAVYSEEYCFNMRMKSANIAHMNRSGTRLLFRQNECGF